MATQAELLELQQLIGTTPMSYQQRMIAANALKGIAGAVTPSDVPDFTTKIPEGGVVKGGSVLDPQTKQRINYDVPAQADQQAADLSRYQKVADQISGNYLIPDYKPVKIKTKAADGTESESTIAQMQGRRAATAADILASSPPNSNGMIYGPNDAVGTKVDPAVYQRIIGDSVMARGGVPGQPSGGMPYIRNAEMENPFNGGGITPDGQYQLDPINRASAIPTELSNTADMIGLIPGFSAIAPVASLAARQIKPDAIQAVSDVAGTVVPTLQSAAIQSQAQAEVPEKQLQPISKEAVQAAVDAVGGKDRDKVAEWLKQNGYETP